MLATFRMEMVKHVLRPRTYVVLGITVVVPLIIAFALKVNPPDFPRPEGGGGRFGGGGGGDLSYFATQTGLFLPVFALEVMSGLLLVVIAALFGGDAVSSEASWGNLRAILTRPIGRGRLLGAKLASALLLTFIATLLVSVVGLAAGGATFGWHALSVPILGIQQSVGHVIANLALATMYVFWGLAAVVALGFMVSTMTDSVAGAIFAPIGFYFVTRILDNIEAIGKIRYIFPTHYYDAWTNLFQGGSTNDMHTGWLIQIPYVLAFSAFGWFWFRRKDILS
jgi:ABC-2 type transport system permease protein